MTTHNRDRPRRFFGSSETYDSEAHPPLSVVPFTVSRSDFDNFSGVDLPMHKSIIRSHGNATNAANGTKSSTEWGSTSAHATFEYRRWEGNPNPTWVTYKTVTYRRTGSLDSLPNPSDPGSSSVAVDKAKSMFVSKARRQMSPAQGGTILGEIRETLHMIHNPALSLRRSVGNYLDRINKMRRGLLKLPKKRRNAAVADTWLEYSFGWAPLLSDIDQSMEALARLTTGIQPLTKVRGYGEFDSLISQSEAGGSSGALSWSYSLVTKDRFRAWLYGAINNVSDPVPTFRGSFGLNPHDFIPTIWELIPYSFLVDYFTNIGDIISAASFNTSSLSYWGLSQYAERECYSSNYRETTVKKFPLPDTVFVAGSFSPRPSSWKRKVFSRTNVPSLVPSLRFEIPGSPQKYINLAALFASARRIHLT